MSNHKDHEHHKHSERHEHKHHEHHEHKNAEHHEHKHDEHHEHHEHEHKHDEHKSSKSSQKKKFSLKKLKNLNKKQIYLPIIGIVLVCFLVVGFVTLRNREGNQNQDTNLVCFSAGNQVVVTANRPGKVMIRFGHYSSIDDESMADQFATTLNNAAFQVDYNGEYTVCVEYEDGTKESRYVVVDANSEPGRLTVNGDILKFDAADDYNIISVSYAYGVQLGKPYANFVRANDDYTAPALGNGWHTFKISATFEGNTKVYYMAAEVTDCKEPVLQLYEDALGVYTYGFDIETVMYAEGEINSWNELDTNEAVIIPSNCRLGLSSFKKGQTYTFGFRSKTKDYFKQITF